VYILDTNHISLLERRGDGLEHLLARLSQVPTADIKVTIISYEEQIRGWTASIASSKTSSGQVQLYIRLQAQLENYCNLSILPFDQAAAARFDELRKLHRRTSTPDLKIAAISLMNEATLLTQNIRDFQNIANLTIEDWTRS
jgi:tRNA(fMet)-specific endonuclease VapC